MAVEMSEEVDIEASSSASDEDLERFVSISNAFALPIMKRAALVVPSV